jgi:hypothetical protein
LLILPARKSAMIGLAFLSAVLSCAWIALSIWLTKPRRTRPGNLLRRDGRLRGFVQARSKQDADAEPTIAQDDPYEEESSSAERFGLKRPTPSRATTEARCEDLEDCATRPECRQGIEPSPHSRMLVLAIPKV